MTKRRKHALALALLLGPFLSCQERLADGEQDDLWRICISVTAARAYDEQGNPVHSILGPGGGNSIICLCMTLEEANEGDYDDYLNDEALRVCLEDAALLGYPEANDCAYWHEDGIWRDYIGFHPFESERRCGQDEGGVGCSVR